MRSYIDIGVNCMGSLVGIVKLGEVVADGETVGQVTSGTFSPILQKPIALAYLPLHLTKSGNTVDVKIRDKLFPATVVKPPFYKRGTHK